MVDGGGNDSRGWRAVENGSNGTYDWRAEPVWAPECAAGDIVELIVAEVRKQRPLFELLKSPGKVILHLNPQNPARPVVLEISSFKV